jgi:hypothetical protein
MSASFLSKNVICVTCMYTCIENLTQTRDYIVPVLRGDYLCVDVHGIRMHVWRESRPLPERGATRYYQFKQLSKQLQYILAFVDTKSILCTRSSFHGFYNLFTYVHS